MNRRISQGNWKIRLSTPLVLEADNVSALYHVRVAQLVRIGGPVDQSLTGSVQGVNLLLV